jgi:hypothetical protein
MAVRDVSNVRLFISATGGAGTFTEIEDIQSYDATHGSEGETRTRVFGKTDPYIRQGDDTDEYSLSGLFNPDDADGQNLLRAAKDGGTTIHCIFLHDPAPAAEKGYRQECRVTEYTDSADAGDEFIEAEFSLIGVGARTNITALP